MSFSTITTRLTAYPPAGDAKQEHQLVYPKANDDKSTCFYTERNEKHYTNDEYTKLINEQNGSEYVAKIEKKLYRIKLRCIDNESISYFTEGGCWMLMRTLNEKYGWKMKAVRKNSVYLHGFCMLPNGDCIDITGIKTTDQMLKFWNADALEDAPAKLQIGQNIEHEQDSFMSTLRLASIFAGEVRKMYTPTAEMAITNRAGL